jgi:hypothetical protein
VCPKQSNDNTEKDATRLTPEISRLAKPVRLD